jgi:hypothetical protein
MLKFEGSQLLSFLHGEHSRRVIRIRAFLFASTTQALVGIPGYAFI